MDDIAFSVVRSAPQVRHGIDAEQYSEQEFLTLEEIRFFGCLALSLRPDRGMIYAYPIPAGPFAVSGDEAPDALRETALRQAHALRDAWFIRRGLELPPAVGGPPYQYLEVPVDEELPGKLIQAVSLRDHLLLRGLGTLIKADMLWQHHAFNEAATMMLFVTLEVSLQLTLRLLRSKGFSDPGPKEAGRFIDKTFNSSSNADGYFIESYEQRVKTIHPASRFGIFAYPPLQADDYYDLRQDLVVLYNFLILGHWWRDLYE